jgi:hypothetical protein
MLPGHQADRKQAIVMNLPWTRSHGSFVPAETSMSVLIVSKEAEYPTQDPQQILVS